MLTVQNLTRAFLLNLTVLKVNHNMLHADPSQTICLIQASNEFTVIFLSPLENMILYLDHCLNLKLLKCFVSFYCTENNASDGVGIRDYFLLNLILTLHFLFVCCPCFLKQTNKKNPDCGFNVSSCCDLLYSCA